ncbi:MAG: hypothetical protein LBF74_13610, partial [Treponema sp.]|nr:hypothetical protein [Treponema sp.]
MANNKRLAEVSKATQFSHDNQPENRGRWPSALSRYIKENRVSATDVRLMISSIVFAHTSKEAALLLGDKKNPPPVGVALIMGALVDDMGKHNIGNLLKLMDRAFGKPKESVDVSGSVNIAPETLDALNAMFHESGRGKKKPRK